MFYDFITKTPLYFTHQIKYTNIDFPQILYNQAKGENYKLFFEQSSKQNNFDNLMEKVFVQMKNIWVKLILYVKTQII